MNSVSVVCTVHEAQGLANASELLAILTQIQPEVIFLEVPLAAFDEYYESCSRQNLESITVRRYRENHLVELVPVDAPTPEKEFFENLQHLHLRIRDESPEYRQLLNRDSSHLRSQGFAYLNSEESSKVWSEVYSAIHRTIERIGDTRLVEIIEDWERTNELREKKMIGNIQEYCSGNTFDRSVFLLGAAHRQGIIDKSREQSETDSTRIQWDYFLSGYGDA
jgi:hypothetical protein